MSEIEIITKLNHSIRDAEWNRDVQFMQKLLDEDLLFRRANGTITDKKTYLNGLADLNNTYDHLENVDVKVNINEDENLATATVIVKASGKRGIEQDPFNGEFRNIRFFRKKEEWKLYAWYNDVINN
jgi:hypothetical protein